MKISENVPGLDSILGEWRGALGNDFVAYRNHCYRVVNFCLAFGQPPGTDTTEKIAIAAGFHDLAIWAGHTYDYLAPSRRLAREYLARIGRKTWCEEIESMIEQHHKMTRFRGRPDWLTESFRKADWVDVSRGRLKFGLAAGFVNEVLAAFPNAGFHKRLGALTRERFRTHPFSPLPMMKF